MADKGRIAVGSDEATELTAKVVARLREQGYELELAGALAQETPDWPVVAQQVGARVASGGAAQGILFCWTGTGVSMAANKVPGVRAALCADAETARGARRWNDANVLCLSLRATSAAVAYEILDAWFAAQPEPSEQANIERVRALDQRRVGPR